MKRTISQKKISQVFNLDDLLGYKPNERQKRLFYELAKDKMVQRTSEGLDIDNKPFPIYTSNYADQKGVTRSSVDLIDTGKMLDSFKEEIGSSVVRIELESDQTDKAYGHITSFRGHPTIKDRGKKRDFFGFKSESDIQDILGEVDVLRTEQEIEERNTFDLADLRNFTQMLALDRGLDGDD